MNAFEITLLILGTTVVVLAVRYLPNALDAIALSASGEPASLLPRGVMPFGMRLRRTFELQAIVSRLALITRLNLPLSSALDAAARNEPFRRAQVFRTMSRMVGSGVPVCDALQAALRGCPDQLVTTLRRAEAVGQLSRALSEQERAIAVTLDVHTHSSTHMRHALAYAALMFLIVGVMVFWHMIVVVPRFKDIFLDFDVAMPPVTAALLGAVQWIVPNGMFITFGIVALLFLFAVVRRIERDGDGPVSRTVAALRWMLPVTRSLDYGLGMAKAIRAMALSMRTGSERSFAHSLPAVVSTTNHLRHRLDDFAQAIAGGIAPAKAAHEAGLGDVFVCALRMVERGEDPQRVLEHAANYYEAIAHRWWQALMALSGPLVTLVLAVLVGFVALALFTPLVTLINAVSESI